MTTQPLGFKQPPLEARAAETSWLVASSELHVSTMRSSRVATAKSRIAPTTRIFHCKPLSPPFPRSQLFRGATRPANPSHVWIEPHIPSWNLWHHSTIQESMLLLRLSCITRPMLPRRHLLPALSAWRSPHPVGSPCETESCHTVGVVLDRQRGQAGEAVCVWGSPHPSHPVALHIPLPRIRGSITPKQEPKNKRILARTHAVEWLNATNSPYHVTVTYSPADFLYRLFVSAASRRRSKNPGQMKHFGTSMRMQR